MNIGTTAALTQKKTAAAVVPSKNNKNLNPIPYQASEKIPGKSTQKHTTTIEDDDEEDWTTVLQTRSPQMEVTMIWILMLVQK